jgi:hypothetical protein
MHGITRPVALETLETTEERKSKADALVWLGGNFVDKDLSSRVAVHRAAVLGQGERDRAKPAIGCITRNPELMVEAV